MKTTGLFESLAISDVILDFMILSIPVPQVFTWYLHFLALLLIVLLDLGSPTFYQAEDWNLWSFPSRFIVSRS